LKRLNALDILLKRSTPFCTQGGLIELETDRFQLARRIVCRGNTGLRGIASHSARAISIRETLGRRSASSPSTGQTIGTILVRYALGHTFIIFTLETALTLLVICTFRLGNTFVLFTGKAFFAVVFLATFLAHFVNADFIVPIDLTVFVATAFRIFRSTGNQTKTSNTKKYQSNGKAARHHFLRKQNAAMAFV
jgi:hypothetical protein